MLPRTCDLKQRDTKNISIEAYTKLHDCRVRHRDPLADKCVYLRAVEASSIEGSRLRPHTHSSNDVFALPFCTTTSTHDVYATAAA